MRWRDSTGQCSTSTARTEGRRSAKPEKFRRSSRESRSHNSSQMVLCSYCEETIESNEFRMKRRDNYYFVFCSLKCQLGWEQIEEERTCSFCGRELHSDCYFMVMINGTYFYYC